MSKQANVSKHAILNCGFHAVTQSDVLQWYAAGLNASRARYVTTVNVAILMMMRKNNRLKLFVDESDLTVADGLPIIWLSKLIRKPLPERVTGIDLCHNLCALAAENGHSVYLLGASQKVLNKTKQQLLKESPRLIIAGTSHGYFHEEEAPKQIDKINQSGADLLFVAMGVPRQEYFLQDNLDKLNIKLAIAIGGSFDVIAGFKKRAPLWMQKAGLEWLFRMLQEPRRLAKRYIVTNVQFLGLSCKALWLSKTSRRI